jgi:hypothetical protein
MKITYANEAVEKQCRVLRTMQPGQEYSFFSCSLQHLTDRGLMKKQQRLLAW